MKPRRLWKLPVLFSVLAVFFVQCDQFNLYEQFELAVPANLADALSIDPIAATLTANARLSFTATGGVRPYTFSIVSGSGTVDANTGKYSAPPGAGTDVVRVSDNRGNTREAAVTVTALQPLVITPSLTTILAGDSVTFTATGGTSPFTFAILAPAHGSINSATGEYTAPGSTATDIIRVTDASGKTSDATATVVAAGALSISPNPATVPVNGRKVFSASGGAPPYSFAIGSGPGSINATTGVYTAPAFTGAVTVRVTDSLLNSSDAAVTVAGGGCGLSFPESEPNDSTGWPWTYVDNFGIVLVPGCVVTITGVTDTGGNGFDVFRFGTGSANFVTFTATWSTATDAMTFELYHASGRDLAESDSSVGYIESLVWRVDAAWATRYFAIKKGKGGVPYTLIISAN